MDPDLISNALLARTQVIVLQHLLSESNDPPMSIDDYEERRRDAISAALKEEQKVEDLLAKRERQLEEIKELTATVDPHKLKLAKELLQKKEELTKKRDELHAVLKEENISLSELLELKSQVMDHSAKIDYLKYLDDTYEQLKDEIEQFERRNQENLGEIKSVNEED